MNNKKTIKKILVGLGIAMALLVVYSMLVTPQDDKSNSGNSLSSLLDNSALGQIKETNTALANAEILKVLGSIQHIKLNDDIFTNPIFKELKDSTFSIPSPLVIGRPNPFLPIGFDIILQTAQNNQFEEPFSLGEKTQEIQSENFFTEGSEILNAQ